MQSAASIERQKGPSPQSIHYRQGDSPLTLYLIIISVLNFQLLQQEFFFILRQNFTIKHFVDYANSLSQAHHNIHTIVTV